jgi:site-specific DNA recombinase
VRTAIYTRLSLDRSGRSENTQLQERECRSFAEDQGWPVVQVFTDNDVSVSRYSKKPRPGYEQLLQLIRAGEIDAVLVTEMTRLYRRLEELLELLRLAEASPLQRIQTTDGSAYLLSTAKGVHSAIASVNNAVLESRRISDRTRRKKKARAAEGRFNGGPRPFGYEPDGVTVRESEAKVVRWCYERLLAGDSLRTLVRTLNAEGGHWHAHTLRQILTSKRIIGVRVHQGNEYPAVWPGIVDREDWQRVQVILDEKRRFVGANKKGTRSYLLTGMAHCGLCGNQLIGSATQGPREGEPRRRYRCRTIDVYGQTTGCGKIVRMAEPVELLVSEAVLHRLDSPEMAAALAPSGEDVSGLLERYNTQKARLDDLITDYATGLLSREQLAQAKSIVEEAIEATRAEMAKLERGRTVAAVPAGQTIREAWEAASLDWRRELVGLLVERVTLHPGRTGACRWSYGGRTWQFDPRKVEIAWRV